MDDIIEVNENERPFLPPDISSDADNSFPLGGNTEPKYPLGARTLTSGPDVSWEDYLEGDVK